MGRSTLNRILEVLLPNRPFVAYLSFWARLVLRARRPFIIGITGSVGKTTTTEMLAAVLMHPSSRPVVGRVGNTSGNMNNDIGVPLTILRYENWIADYVGRFLMVWSLPFRALRLATAPTYPRTLILEYGAGGTGHLHHLARLAPPSIGIVTTIGPAHLDRLKTLAGVVREKRAIVSAVPPSGLVILGRDHDHVAELESQARAPVLKIAGRGLDLSRGITRAVCRHLGTPGGDIVDAVLRDFEPPKGRLNRYDYARLTVIDDSYNANPLSMTLGLDTLADTAVSGRRRVAILGTMRELGEEADRYHDEVGAYARGRADLIIGVGDLAKLYRPDHWLDDAQSCADHLEEFLRPDDCVLVKGSASVRLSCVTAKLCELGEQRPAQSAGATPEARPPTNRPRRDGKSWAERTASRPDP